MRRSQLEHIIRAASVIADDDETIIIGSLAATSINDELRQLITQLIAADFARVTD